MFLAVTVVLTTDATVVYCGFLCAAMHPLFHYFISEWLCCGMLWHKQPIHVT